MCTDVNLTRLPDFAGVAETVAELIKQSKARPISIGIAGAWGVGKSSMIRLVQGELERRDADKRVLFVNFNAWLYQGYDDARAALMDVIGEALLQETEKRKRGSRRCSISSSAYASHAL